MKSLILKAASSSKFYGDPSKNETYQILSRFTILSAVQILGPLYCSATATFGTSFLTNRTSRCFQQACVFIVWSWKLNFLSTIDLAYSLFSLISKIFTWFWAYLLLTFCISIKKYKITFFLCIVSVLSSSVNSSLYLTWWCSCVDITFFEPCKEFIHKKKIWNLMIEISKKLCVPSSSLECFWQNDKL